MPSRRQCGGPRFWKRWRKRARDASSRWARATCLRGSSGRRWGRLMPETLVAGAVPPRVLPTSDIAARLGVTEQWIESRTGVRSRRVASDDDRLADLAALAGRGA